MRRAILFFAVATGIGGSACSLDLDKSLIGDGDGDGDGRDASATGGGGSSGSGGGAGASAGGASGSGGTSGGSGSGGSGGTAGGTGGVAGAGTGGAAGSGGGAGVSGGGGNGGVDAGGCTTNGDCTPSNACFEGQCVGGSCVFDICPSATVCMARDCDTNTDTCGSEMPIGFRTTQIDVGDDVACGGDVTRCIAAMGDVVVVGTESGLRAWRIVNPLEPQPIAVASPAFPIRWVVGSGNRILVLGPVNTGKLSVGWLDLPTDPRADSISIDGALVNFTETIGSVLSANTESFFVVKQNAAQFFPAALLTPPVANNATVTLEPSSGVSVSSLLVASSETRLVTYRTDTTSGFAPVFSLERNAGTGTAQNAGEQNLVGTAGEAPTAPTAHFFSGGPSGALGWTSNEVTRSDAGLPRTQSVAYRWLLVGTEETFNASRSVTLESYGSDFDFNQALAGPSVIVTDTSAVVTASNPANQSLSNVRAVLRTGDTLSLSAAAPVTLAFPPTALGMAAGDRFGFVLTSTSGAPSPDTTVHVFDPGCGG